MTARNFFGHTSELKLTFAKHRVESLHFTAPFKIMKPFQEQGRTQVMVQMASAGLMAGDRQEICVIVHEGARAEILPQAFGKIHRMEEGEAKRQIKLSLAQNAELWYMPLPLLPFADSAFENTTEITLADNSGRLLYADMLTCGRLAHGEKFAYRHYFSRLHMYLQSQLLYRDNLRFVPAEMCLDDFCLYENYTHLGNFLLYGYELDLNTLRETLAKTLAKEDTCCGVSNFASQGMVIKILAHGSEPLLAVGEVLRKHLIRNLILK